MAVQRTSALLLQLQPEHVLKAIQQLDGGASTRFANSTKFDVLYKGQRYAPKRVAGLALEALTKEQFKPTDFGAGEDSSCFRALSRCGFLIVPKRAAASPMPLEDVIAEILTLQANYSSKNTADMQRRGFLIRNVLPDKIRDRLEVIQAIFSAEAYTCSVEGSDGKGLKNVSPWVRIADLDISPSATRGWYVVLHFPRGGGRFYATLGCGATTFVAGSLVDVPDTDLARQVAWARKLISSAGLNAAPYDETISLEGNDLSRQFEKSTAFAKSYLVSEFDEGQFWKDLIDLCKILIVIYEGDRLGKAPLSEAPEVVAARTEIEDIARPKVKSGRGPGRGLTHPERCAVERRAMSVAKAGLLRDGFTDVFDKSSTDSYDYLASKSGQEWRVEVKGTTSGSCDCILLTANELDLHKKHCGRTVLAIVYGINLKKNGVDPRATDGTLELLNPWDMTDWQFEATAYRAALKKL